MHTDLAQHHDVHPMRRSGPCGAIAQPSALDPVHQLQMQVLDILDFGVMIIDVLCRVRHANPVALALCDADGPMSLIDGQVQLSMAKQHRLEQAVHAALRGQWSMLALRRNGQPLSVAVVPLAGLGGGGDAVVALLTGGEGRPSRLALQFFKQNHGLTSAEAGVLDALCDGLNPTQIADAGGVAVCTVRSQISAVRSKTGARSIGHLLRMVGGLPTVARPTALNLL